MSKLSYIPPVFGLSALLNAAGNPVSVAQPAFLPASLDVEWWAAITGTPAAVSSVVNPVTEAASAGLVLDVNMNGGSSAGASFLSLTARKKAGATAVLDNTVTLSILGVELGHILVDAATQSFGQLHWVSSDGATVDPRAAFQGSYSALAAGTIEADDEIYTKNNHGLVTGQPVHLDSLAGGTGFSAGNFWFHRLGPHTGYLCDTRALALAGTPHAASTDATAVILTPVAGLCLDLTTLDPALELVAHLAGLND